MLGEMLETAEVLFTVTSVTQVLKGGHVETSINLLSSSEHISGSAAIVFNDPRFLIETKLGSTLKLRLEQWPTEEQISASKLEAVHA